MTRIRKEFESGDELTFHDIEARCDISTRNAREYLKILHDPMKEIRIVRWRRDSPQGPPVAVYLWGPGEDVPKPAPRDSKERKKIRRQREGVKQREASLKRSRRALNKVKEYPSLTTFMLGIEKDVS